MGVGEQSLRADVSVVDRLKRVGQIVRLVFCETQVAFLVDAQKPKHLFEVEETPLGLLDFGDPGEDEVHGVTVGSVVVLVEEQVVVDPEEVEERRQEASAGRDGAPQLKHRKDALVGDVEKTGKGTVRIYLRGRVREGRRRRRGDRSLDVKVLVARPVEDGVVGANCEVEVVAGEGGEDLVEGEEVGYRVVGEFEESGGLHEVVGAVVVEEPVALRSGYTRIDGVDGLSEGVVDVCNCEGGVLHVDQVACLVHEGDRGSGEKQIDGVEELNASFVVVGGVVEYQLNEELDSNYSWLACRYDKEG